ncbi:MAG: hypothetical protein JSV32_04970 [Dehalococcoidia bacterium]|nr:MAG: hypothetical protein JSV32_04970 [Dehalococcoidia bacterium]
MLADVKYLYIFDGNKWSFSGFNFDLSGNGWKTDQEIKDNDLLPVIFANTAEIKREIYKMFRYHLRERKLYIERNRRRLPSPMPTLPTDEQLWAIIQNEIELLTIDFHAVPTGKVDFMSECTPNKISAM